MNTTPFSHPMSPFSALCVLFVGSLLLATHIHVYVHAAKYPNQHLPEGNTTTLATCQTLSFLHVFALGNDAKLWHRWTSVIDTVPNIGNWSDWSVIGAGPWDSDPSCGVNVDGTVEVFIRNHVNLDLWQVYQLDPNDATSWSDNREASCFTPPNCKTPRILYYWNTQPSFPTSDISIVNDPFDSRLQLFYRGFDGALYVCRQTEVGAHSYSPPLRFDVILE